jgi:hypothetical protein
LPGLLSFFGDKLAGLSSERMKMLQQTLPVADVRPMSLYPYFSMMPVWNLNIRHEILGDYNVVALFNWKDEPRKISFTAQELGVEPDAEYVLYEFWTEKCFGSMKGSVAMDITARSVRLLAMHRVKAIPQWITSDRHIAQNAIELKEFKWNSDNRTLEGRVQLIGAFPLTIRLRVPKEFSLKKVDCPDMKCSVKEEENNILATTFEAKRTGEYAFNIAF